MKPADFAAMTGPELWAWFTVRIATPSRLTRADRLDMAVAWDAVLARNPHLSEIL